LHAQILAWPSRGWIAQGRTAGALRVAARKRNLADLMHDKKSVREHMQSRTRCVGSARPG